MALHCTPLGSRSVLLRHVGHTGHDFELPSLLPDTVHQPLNALLVDLTEAIVTSPERLIQATGLRLGTEQELCDHIIVILPAENDELRTYIALHYRRYGQMRRLHFAENRTEALRQLDKLLV